MATNWAGGNGRNLVADIGLSKRPMVYPRFFQPAFDTDEFVFVLRRQDDKAFVFGGLVAVDLPNGMATLNDLLWK